MSSEKKQYDAFQLTSDGFIYKDSQYRIGEVLHLYFHRVRTVQRRNFVKLGEAESAYLGITLLSGKQIVLSFDESTILYGFNLDKKDDFKNLMNLYIFLSEKTFANRLQPYLNQIQSAGYFVFGECRFYPRDKIVFRSKEFPLHSTTFLKSYGCIEMKLKDSTFLDKVVRHLPFTATPQFGTQVDSDVIFYLLDKHFGLRWGK